VKVAFCIHGHLRGFDECWPYLKHHLLDPYKPDVFAMAWVDSVGTHLHPVQSTDPHKHPAFDQSAPRVGMDAIRSVIDRMDPVDIHLDHYWAHDRRFEAMVEHYSGYHHHWPHHRPKGAISLNWARSVTMNMKLRHEQALGFRYDRVICTRWDIMYPHHVDLSIHDANAITLTNMHGPEVTSDIWASGPSHLMDGWSEQIHHIDELVQAGTFNLGTHEWMKAWLIHRGIPWQNRDDLGVWIHR